MMQAIRVHEHGGPEVLRLEEIPDPQPGPGEVLIRVQAVGVNPVDTYVRSGGYARPPKLPYIPGGDAAGTVEAVGDGVRRFRAGDRVYRAGASGGLMTGGYAELAVCLESQLHPLPEGLSFAQGAAVGVPYATAYRALVHKAQARPGETVFVHGASGGVGLAAVQLAAARGIRVLGSASSERGRERVLAEGAEAVFDHSAPDDVDQILEATGGEGPQVILEMAADINLEKDLGLIARFGRIVVVGCRGPREINARGAMVKDAQILGMALWNSTDEEMEEIHRALVAGLANGSLRPLVRREFPLAEAATAHEMVLQSGALGKIVLVP